MDCSTCRSLFSESFDGRLSGERRQDFIRHVQACKPCDSEYALYQRVFSAVRGLPDEAAPPFRVPAEVPGALSAHRFGRPRFARVAAAVLIMIGLAGTHVLVFQWSRDHATRSKPSELVSPIQQEVGTSTPLTMASISPLPAALRDHVDATDLYIRTAASLPDDPSAVDLARADWAGIDLAKRTRDLRAMPLSPETVPPEHLSLIRQYLSDVDEDFIPNMTGQIERAAEQAAPVRMIREAAVRNRVVRNHDLDKMKVLVAPLARGTTFTRTVTLLYPLSPDGQLFLDSKQARLRGEYQRAITNLQRFESDFQASPLRPAAQYLTFDTYATAGRWSEAISIAGQASCRCKGGALMQPFSNAAEWTQLGTIRFYELRRTDQFLPWMIEFGADGPPESGTFEGGRIQTLLMVPEVQKKFGLDQGAASRTYKK